MSSHYWGIPHDWSSHMCRNSFAIDVTYVGPSCLVSWLLIHIVSYQFLSSYRRRYCSMRLGWGKIPHCLALCLDIGVGFASSVAGIFVLPMKSVISCDEKGFQLLVEGWYLLICFLCYFFDNLSENNFPWRTTLINSNSVARSKYTRFNFV